MLFRPSFHISLYHFFLLSLCPRLLAFRSLLLYVTESSHKDFMIITGRVATFAKPFVKNYFMSGTFNSQFVTRSW